MVSNQKDHALEDTQACAWAKHDTRDHLNTKKTTLWNPHTRRTRRRSPRKARLHHSWSSKLAARGHPNNTAGTSNRDFIVDAQCEARSSATTRAAAAKNVLALRPMWLSPTGKCWALRPRPHGAHEPETWETSFHARKHCLPATVGSRSL